MINDFFCARTRADQKANLPHNISEESLGLFFAKQGPVGTVKIMWRKLKHVPVQQYEALMADHSKREAMRC